MLAQNKPILLLKEKRLKTLPTDVVGQLYRSFDSYDIGSTVQPSIKEWLRDIGIVKSQAERQLLFVSYGGTCRCAMAKIALEQAQKGRHLPYNLRVMSVAHAFGGTNEASKGARRAIYEAYGEDYLQSHRVIRRNAGLLKDADLILIMEDALKEGMPENKTFNFGSLCVSGCYVRSRRSRESRRPFPLLFALCTNSKKAR